MKLKKEQIHNNRANLLQSTRMTVEELTEQGNNFCKAIIQNRMLITTDRITASGLTYFVSFREYTGTKTKGTWNTGGWNNFIRDITGYPVVDNAVKVSFQNMNMHFALVDIVTRKLVSAGIITEKKAQQVNASCNY
jgi:hypothetical protein